MSEHVTLDSPWCPKANGRDRCWLYRHPDDVPCLGYREALARLRALVGDNDKETTT